MRRKCPKRHSKKFIHPSKFLKPHTLNPNLSRFCHIIGAFDLMDLAPLGKVLSEVNMTSSKEEDLSSSEKRVHQRKGIVHPIKLGRKEIHQGEIRF